MRIQACTHSCTPKNMHTLDIKSYALLILLQECFTAYALLLRLRERLILFNYRCLCKYVLFNAVIINMLCGFGVFLAFVSVLKY